MNLVLFIINDPVNILTYNKVTYVLTESEKRHDQEIVQTR